MFDPKLITYYTDFYIGQGYDRNTSYAHAVSYLTTYYANLAAQAVQPIQPILPPPVVYHQQPAYIATIQPQQQNATVAFPDALKYPSFFIFLFPRNYVTRVFDHYNYNKESSFKALVNKKLKALIELHQQQNTVLTTDWSLMPVIEVSEPTPAVVVTEPIKFNLNAAASPVRTFASVVKNNVGNNNNNVGVISKNSVINSIGGGGNNAKILKLSDASLSGTEKQIIFSSSSPKSNKTKKNTNFTNFSLSYSGTDISKDDFDPLSIPISSKKKKHSSSFKSLTIDDEDFSGDNLPGEELDKRSKRSQRFEGASDERERNLARQKIVNKRAKDAFLAAGAEGNPDVLDWDIHTVIGTATKLEKSYLRLTSAPDPSTVRPLKVLEKVLPYLKEKWRADKNYVFVCDQFKSLRQDLTVQRLKNDFTVQVYECHARIALEKGDLGEYNQCQSQLKQLYELKIPGNEDEYISYRILYFVYSMNKRDLNITISKLSSTQKQQPNIYHALQVQGSVSRNDYHTFFKLYQQCPGMSAYLMDFFIERQRKNAMLTITKVYQPSILVAVVAKELGYWSEEEEKSGGVKLFRGWLLNQIGYKGLKGKDLEINCKDCYGFFSESMKTGERVDIKGQL